MRISSGGRLPWLFPNWRAGRTTEPPTEPPAKPGDDPAERNRKQQSLRVKRFMARYIIYLEIFGFVTVTAVALAIVACFFWKVDDIIRGDVVAIQPRAESIKWKADALVVRVLVQKHQQVRKGDALIEVVDDPQWMSRYLVMRQMRTLLDEFDAPGQAAELARKRLEEAQEKAREAALAGVKKAGPTLTETKKEEEEEKPPLPVVPLTPEEQKVRATIQQRLAVWEKQTVPRSPRIVICAPISGVVVAPDDLDFKKIDADAEILKVVDLSDLRLTAKLSGDTAADARTGQTATIKAIYPDYKTGVTFRGDTVPEGSYRWQNERVTSYSLLDASIKDKVKDAFKDRTITRQDDIPFNVTEVTDVELNSDLQTVPVDESEVATPDKSVLPADAPAELELSGKVVEGKHLLVVQLTDVPPAVIKEANDSVTNKLRGKVVAVPQEPETEGGEAPIRHLRVEGVGNTRIIAKMKGENDKAKGPTKELKREAKRNSIRGGFLERQYEATVQIQNPPPFLKAKVLELLEQGKEVKAKVELKTGRRPVAFLLLRR